GTPVGLGVPALVPDALELGDAQPGEAGGLQRRLHLVELEGLDDCSDELHRWFLVPVPSVLACGPQTRSIVVSPPWYAVSPCSARSRPLTSVSSDTRMPITRSRTFRITKVRMKLNTIAARLAISCSSSSVAS